MVRNNSFQGRIKPLVLALGCLYGTNAGALGLGELSLKSYLNEPLNARVELINTEGLDVEQVRVQLATRDEFKQRGVDRPYFLTKLEFDVEAGANNALFISVKTDQPVLEPYLDFIVEARWPNGRLLREYTLLLDPPVFAPASERVSARRQIAAESGTVVNTKDNETSSVKKPAREFASDATAMPQKGQKYLVQRNDTLWQIAERSRPEGASINQTMLDIQRLNPNAFVRGNINLIKAGYVVYLPKGSEMQAPDEAQAKAEVDKQTEEWREGRAAAVATLRIASEDIEETAPSTTPVDVARMAELEAEVVANKEVMDQASRENADLSARLAEMEKQYDTLQRIVRVKDDQISALQQALTGDNEPAVDASAMEEAVSKAEEMADKAAEQAVPKPITRVEDAGLLGFLKDKLLYILGGLAALIAAALVMRRVRGEQGDAVDAHQEPVLEQDFKNVELDQELDVDDADDPIEGAQPEQGRAVELESKFQNDQTYLDQSGGDPIAEADIYIAYGRYDQAVSVVKSAIEQAPENTEYRLRLMTLGIEAGDMDLVKQQYSDLLTLNDADALAQADELIAGLPEADNWMAGTAQGQAEGAEALTDVELEIDDSLSKEDVSSDLQAELDSFAYDLDAQMASDSDELPRLDLGELEANQPPSELSGTDDALEYSFGELEIEGAEDLSDTPDDTADELDLSSDADDDDEVDMVIASEVDEAATKMDLARAYLDMGDEDGARLILEEVLGDEQASAYADEARELLSGIG